MADLTRFGVAMETSLLTEVDDLARERGSTRSELLRDLARAEIVRSFSRKRVAAYASVTLVYNHHVRDLTERLMDMQHELGDQVRSTMHVHLDHDRCLELIVMRGRADKLQSVADKLFGTRGVLQGSIAIVADADPAHAPHVHPTARPPARPPARQKARPKARRAVRRPA